jgi:hypothetical protein
MGRRPSRWRRLRASLRARRIVVIAELHLAKDAFTLHLFLERFERLVDIVVTNENLHACFLLNM